MQLDTLATSFVTHVCDISFATLSHFSRTMLKRWKDRAWYEVSGPRFCMYCTDLELKVG